MSVYNIKSVHAEKAHNCISTLYPAVLLLWLFVGALYGFPF